MTVILHLQQSHSLAQFFRYIDSKPFATSLLKLYAQENDLELLKDFYYQDDRKREAAVLALRESEGLKDFGEKMGRVRIGLKSFGEDKGSSFEVKVRPNFF